MINKKRALSVFSIFAISFIMILAFATDAATTTPVDGSKNLDTGNSDVSASSVYNDTNFTELDNKSTGQVRILGDDDGIGDNNKNTSIEVNFGDGWETWNSSEYISKQSENYGTLSVIRSPVQATKKIDVQPILDRIGYQEAQFPDVQGVTLYGLDDASVMEYYGYGDCWADACWLYDKLSAEGIPVRIMGYEDGVYNKYGVKSRHTWVEINVGNGWESWDYKKYDSQHCGDAGFGPSHVLIEPGNTTADILSLDY